MSRYTITTLMELHKVIFINYTPIKLFFFMRSKKQESHREKQSIDI
jgi:hypothetical protein